MTYIIYVHKVKCKFSSYGVGKVGVTAFDRKQALNALGFKTYMTFQ